MARSVFRQAQAVRMDEDLRNERRVMRRPQHPFSIRQRPFVLQPFLLAPVLPGETFSNLLLQARVVTDPLKSPLVGWWQEYYFFYVKLNDLDDRELFRDMLVKNASISSLYASSPSNAYYSFDETINWSEKCLKVVTEHYFRNEGEDWNDYLIDGLPVASVNTEMFTNSLISSDQLADDDVAVTVGVDDQITASEIDGAMRTWQMLHDMNMTDMTYEDYLRTFGVNVATTAELHRPELIRYVRNWTYPTNTVNPAGGGVNSAASWSINERADKKRLFREPGFIFGVTTTRAKVLFANLGGSAAGALRELADWFPAMMTGDDRATLQGWPELTGPVPNYNTGDNAGYTIDLRDLLIYGDQFTNFDRTAVTDANLVSLPTADGQRRYLDGTEVDKLFHTPANGKLVRQDGLVSLNIASRQSRDRTPGVPAQAV